MIPGPRALVAVGTLLATCLAAPASSAATGVAPAVTCHGHPATIVGTAEDDVLVGTSQADVIVGLGGDDRIRALGGDDVVCGLAGSDEIDGGPGSDRLFGGIDRWWADRGGANRVGDRVLPGPGDDYVDLGADSRTVTGYLERDTLVYRQVHHAVTADLSRRPGTVSAEGVDTVRVHGQMGVVGSRFGDTIIGSPKADTLTGGWGDDVLEGRGGKDELDPDYYDETGRHVDADVVRGGNGRDFFSSVSGADQLYGGPGPDFFDVRSNGSALVAAGSGDDGVSAVIDPSRPVDLRGGVDDDYLFLDYDRVHHLPGGTLDMATGTFVRDGMPGVAGRLAGFENVGLDARTDWRVHGTEGADEISGANQVWSLGGDDKVYGTSGKDYVDAGDGNDLVWAYTGQDTCLNAERVRGCEVR